MYAHVLQDGLAVPAPEVVVQKLVDQVELLVLEHSASSNVLHEKLKHHSNLDLCYSTANGLNAIISIKKWVCKVHFGEVFTLPSKSRCKRRTWTGTLCFWPAGLTASAALYQDLDVFFIISSYNAKNLAPKFAHYKIYYRNTELEKRFSKCNISVVPFKDFD